MRCLARSQPSPCSLRFGSESKLGTSMRVYEAPWDEVPGTLSAQPLFSKIRV